MTWGNWQNVDDNQPSSLMVFVVLIPLSLLVCVSSTVACLEAKRCLLTDDTSVFLSPLPYPRMIKLMNQPAVGFMLGLERGTRLGFGRRGEKRVGMEKKEQRLYRRASIIFLIARRVCAS